LLHRSRFYLVVVFLNDMFAGVTLIIGVDLLIRR